ncbi:MAG: DUF523 domain-containing protein [Butyricicoccus sp.]
MKVMVSACLLGENCKYNGGNNKNPDVLEFLQGKTVIPVCPEVMGGLPVPRVPVELQHGIAVNRNGENVHRQFCDGVHKAVEIAKREQIDLAILQSRSPTCGVRNIYDGTFTKQLIDGQGLLVRALIEEGFRVMDAEELAQETDG